LMMVGVCLLFVTVRHRTDMRAQIRLFMAAFLVRFALSIVIYRFGLVQVLHDEDASGWYNGVLYAEKWAKQDVGLLGLPGAVGEAFSQQNQGYYYLLGGFFYLTGLSARLSAAAMNGFFGALTVVFAYRVARTLFSSWVARRVGWWTCLFPSLVVWSAQTVKEPLVILLETVALYGCMRLREKGVSLRHILLCATAVVLLFPFRFYASYLVGLAVLVSLIGPGLTGIRAKFAAVALGVILIWSAVNVVGDARQDSDLEQISLDRIQLFREAVAEGGMVNGAGSGVKTADVRTPAGLISGTFVGAAHLLLAPFPWELEGASARALFTIPELLVWWWLFFKGVIPGAAYLLRYRFRDISTLLLFIFGFGLLYSLMFGNVGLVFRQRAQLMPWLLVFGMVGLERLRLKRRMSPAWSGVPTSLEPAHSTASASPVGS
jgi:4-amino-4-deoxy-L-arabinose transferase-like glycosyltransferase